jgi:hypothetical protein
MTKELENKRLMGALARSDTYHVIQRGDGFRKGSQSGDPEAVAVRKNDIRWVEQKKLDCSVLEKHRCPLILLAKF